MSSENTIPRKTNKLFLKLFLIVSLSLTSNLAAMSKQDSSMRQKHGDNHSDGHAMHKKVLKSATSYTRSTVNYIIPDITLVNMDNEPVSLKKELTPDTPILVNFIFTTCTTICPIMSATFSQVQSLLGEEADKIHMISISIDPEQDTPKNLKKYARKFDALPTWHFLTGKLNDIKQTLKAFDVYRGDKMNHVPVTLLRKNANTHWVRLDGLTSAQDLISEYRKI